MKREERRGEEERRRASGGRARERVVGILLVLLLYLLDIQLGYPPTGRVTVPMAHQAKDRTERKSFGGTSWVLQSKPKETQQKSKSKAKSPSPYRLTLPSFSSKKSAGAARSSGNGEGRELASNGEHYGSKGNYSAVTTWDEEKGGDGLHDESEDEGEVGDANELRVIVVEAKGLTASDYNVFQDSSSDPYCVLKFRGRKKQTVVQKDNLNPYWGQKFVFPLGRATKGEQAEGRKSTSSLLDPNVITISVVDYDTALGSDQLGQDDKLGMAQLSIDILSTKYSTHTLPLHGQVQGTNMFKTSEATGSITIKAKCVRNPARAKQFVVDKPLEPAALKFVASALLAIVWLVAFLSSVIINVVGTLLEYIGTLCLTLVVRFFTGIKCKIGGLSIRFGAGSGPTEVVINEVVIYNPNGGYESPYVAEIIRIDVHAHLLSFFAASKWVKFKYLGGDASGGGNAPEEAALRVDMIRVDGLTLYTEKNSSPLVSEEKMLVNLKALIGLTDEPQDAEAPKFVEEEKKEDVQLALPKEAMNLPLLFKMRNVIVTDVNLYAADFISDILGDPDGCGSIKKQKAVEIREIMVSYDDFHEKKKMLWLGDLIGIIVSQALEKIPVSAILRSAMMASGSKWSGDFIGANQKVLGVLTGKKLGGTTQEKAKKQASPADAHYHTTERRTIS
jgi:hypothetical protein